MGGFSLDLVGDDVRIVVGEPHVVFHLIQGSPVPETGMRVSNMNTTTNTNTTYGLVGNVPMTADIAMDMAKKVPLMDGNPVNWIQKVLIFASYKKCEVLIKFNHNDEWFYKEKQRALKGRLVKGEITWLELESIHYIGKDCPLFWFTSGEENVANWGPHWSYQGFRIEQVEWIVLA